MESNSRLLKTFRWVFALIALCVGSSVFAFGNPSKYVLVTATDSGISFSGAWSVQFTPPASYNQTYFGESYRTIAATGGAATATARWDFGQLALTPGGLYLFEAFIPDFGGNSGLNIVYRLESAPYDLFAGTCGVYAPVSSFAAANMDIAEGSWGTVGTATLASGPCYRVVLDNANNPGATIQASAMRAQRLYESSATITDMPRVATALAPATTNITSSSGPVPTIVTTLTVTCPQVGNVMVTASGESAAQTNVAGTNFNGLAYSISKNSTATDNANIVQSSSLATFNGDANRDFLNATRVDTCAAGETITYRLTAYRSQLATGPASFIYNGRLVGQYFASGF